MSQQPIFQSTNLKFYFLQILFGVFVVVLNAQNALPTRALVNPKTGHKSGELLVQFANVEAAETFQKNLPPTIERFEWILPPLSIGRVFLEKNADEKAVLTLLRKNLWVQNAQFNHYLDNRATPNDPNFTNQWFHKNEGQNGGTNDADIDSDEAWDITKGGATVDGDSIVVAVIDNGTNLTHPDLQQNLWFNRREIPNNGIDDDQNGYIDDVRGWNAGTQSDAVDGGTHGVEVSGVIGAAGNNGRGVAGVNWAVKIMTIVSEGDEASIVAAYGYALAQRRLFNRTQGRRGAFVVATNSSFGATNKFPTDAPIWCAMYDSLGLAGVLNIGATANASINVDEVGDLPSTCPSPYTLIVTSTNDRDVRAGDAAFGLVNVDVAAPGVSIWTTLANGDIGPKSGTSLACPVVAGIVALAYSVNCSDFINLAKSNPSAAALEMRRRIINAVEVKTDLQGKIVTGGRVNSRATLQQVLSYCANCNQAARVNAAVTTNAATISLSIPAGNRISARFRKRGTTTWQTLTTNLPPLSISGLEACTEYEIELTTTCTTNSSQPFVYIFKTDGCCSYPDNILITNVLNNQISIRTTKVTAATGYRVCLKETTNAPTCALTQTFSDTVFTISNLKRCQNYRLSVSSVCANGLSADTVLNLKTKGCGACLDSNYCRSNGSTANEWIDSLAIGDFKIISGKSNGYVRFDTITTELVGGKTYRLGVKPAFSGGVAFNQALRMWIDINADGDFTDAGEQLVEIQRFNAATTVNFTLPTVPADGVSRLRVAMKYLGFSGTMPQPCDMFSGGEVEDYCVSLKKSVGTTDILRGGISVYPNPFDNHFTVKNQNPDNPITALTLYALDGRILFTRRLQSFESELVISDLPPLSKGVFILKVGTLGGSFAVKLIR
jgi:serine protease